MCLSALAQNSSKTAEKNKNTINSLSPTRNKIANRFFKTEYQCLNAGFPKAAVECIMTKTSGPKKKENFPE